MNITKFKSACELFPQLADKNNNNRFLNFIKIDDLREFMNYPYNTILNNVKLLEERDIMLTIKDRYQLLKINITKEDLEQDNLDTAIVALEKIKMNENLLKNNINIDELESECEFGKILKSKI